MFKKISILLLLLSAAFVSEAQNNNTVLWRINNPANGRSSYLFGTIHLPQEKFMQLSDSVYRAVINTNIFYGELNYANMYEDMIGDEGFFRSKLMYLDSVKKTASWRRLVAAVNRNYKASIDPDSLEQFSRFGQNLISKYMEPEPGVTGLDIALSKYAITLGKKTKGLETFKFQVDMMYKILDARLTDTTLLFNDEIVMAANMKRYYINQQLDSMTTLIESMNYNYRTIAFDKRNMTMADSIQQITSTTTAFFAVGCGHLLGKNGLISLLRAKGLQLTPVFSDKKISITLMQSFTDGFSSSIKKEFRKRFPYNDEEVMPEERIEEIKDDIKLSVPPPPPPPPPIKKARTKKTVTKTKNKS